MSESMGKMIRGVREGKRGDTEAWSTKDVGPNPTTTLGPQNDFKLWAVLRLSWKHKNKSTNKLKCAEETRWSFQIDGLRDHLELTKKLSERPLPCGTRPGKSREGKKK